MVGLECSGRFKASMGLEFGETLFGFRATGGAAALALTVVPMLSVE